jgi:hypothetical protein
MAFLLAVTLVWGGCLSCSQYFRFPGAKAGCCDPVGRCGKIPTQKSAPKDCTIQPMALTSPAPDVGPPTADIAYAPSPANRTPEIEAALVIAFVPKEAPPDLCLLHSVFLI